jgi:hypothetical protein
MTDLPSMCESVPTMSRAGKSEGGATLPRKMTYSSIFTSGMIALAKQIATVDANMSNGVL